MISQERFFLFPSTSLNRENNSASWVLTYHGVDYTAKIKNAKAMYDFAEGSIYFGKTITSTVIGPEEIQLFQEVTGIDDIFSLAAVSEIGLDAEYIGPEVTDIFIRWPELEGQEEAGTDEEGNITYRDIISREGIWNGFPRV